MSRFAKISSVLRLSKAAFRNVRSLEVCVGRR